MASPIGVFSPQPYQKALIIQLDETPFVKLSSRAYQMSSQTNSTLGL
jgi:hypothetical protein